MEEAGLVIDELSLADHMSEKNLHAVGGLAGLSRLSGGVATTANLDYYSGKIRDAYLSKSVRSKVSEILEADSETSGADLLAMLSTSENALRGSLAGGSVTLDSVVAQEVSRALQASGEPRGLPTGIGLDRALPGGLPRGKVTTIFADTGSFKSTLSLQMIFAMAKAGYRGLLAPLEDNDELTAQRWIAQATGVPYGRIAGGVLNAEEKVEISKLEGDEYSYLSRIQSVDGIEPKIDNIIRAVAAASAKGGVDFVLVDYIQLLQGYGSKQDILTDAMQKAQLASKRYDVCWIFLSQQNDKSVGRSDPRPHLGDMFNSSAMKQCSKTVIALFRPSEVWPNPKGNTHPLWGMYSRMIERNPVCGDEMYRNIIEVWTLKNLIGVKKTLHGLMAKPETGVLDPIDIGTLTRRNV